MRETEIRSILSHVCRELDARARRSAASAMLGASLLVPAGCSDDPGLPDRDAAVDGGQLDSGAVAEYMAPADDAGTGTGGAAGDLDSGAVVKYMAPNVDSGPPTDGGAAPAYMAPQVDSGGPVALYMAVEVPG
jgi:hypothetical protein